ncbi:MAG: acetylglutamate/acetylaminoadipate kinase [Halobacteria archaeon]|nr:acetylglutamate/acetylaminoadipate kinase [Halobacteria archaeon]
MFVVKIGGTEGVDPERVLDDLAQIADEEGFVVVHGGSGVVDDLHEKLDVETRYVESPSGMKGRYTDEESMEVFKTGMSKVNIDLVEGLQSRGVNALGLSGVDGRLLEGEHKDTLIVKEGDRKKVLRGDHSGKIEEVNSDLLELLLDAGYVPVVGVPIVSHDGTAVNTDADRAAARVAGALGCELAVLSDVPGLLRDPDDETSLVERVEHGSIDDVKEEYAEGRMKKKLLAAREALDSGAERVVLGDANVENPVSRALEGEGTVIGGERG